MPSDGDMHPRDEQRDIIGEMDVIRALMAEEFERTQNLHSTRLVELSARLDQLVLSHMRSARQKTGQRSQTR